MQKDHALVQGFFNEEGFVNREAIQDIMPKHFNGTPEQLAFRLASTVRVRPSFMEKHFTRLNLQALFYSNDVPEEIVQQHASTVAEVIIGEIIMATELYAKNRDLGVSSAQLILTLGIGTHGYSGETLDMIYENVMDKFKTDMEVVGPTDGHHVLEMVLNRLMIAGQFTPRFIVNNIGQYGFRAMESLFFREDVNEAYDVVDFVSAIPYKEIYDMLSFYEANKGRTEEEVKASAAIVADDLKKPAFTEEMWRTPILIGDRAEQLKHFLYRKLQYDDVAATGDGNLRGLGYDR